MNYLLWLTQRPGPFFWRVKGQPQQLPTMITMDNYLFDQRPPRLQVFIEAFNYSLSETHPSLPQIPLFLGSTGFDTAAINIMLQFLSLYLWIRGKTSKRLETSKRSTLPMDISNVKGVLNTSSAIKVGGEGGESGPPAASYSGRNTEAQTFLLNADFLGVQSTYPVLAGPFRRN